MTKQVSYLPAEWAEQSGVQLTWPDEQTDWVTNLDEVIPVYVHMAREIMAREKLLLVCRDKSILPDFLQEEQENLIIREMPVNDTWARDHGPVTLLEEGEPVLLNFRFNGWGMKFAACDDNQITPNLYQAQAFRAGVPLRDYSYFTFEGGAVESNGQGCLLTTSECLLSKNRNEHLSKNEIEFFLKTCFQAEKVLWLDHGFLEGDDTDSHIDTLARFCSEDTIAYVKCTDPSDIHFGALQKMEAQLQQLTDQDGHPFKLVALPFPDSIVDEDGQRLPATYANFLIVNQAVLFPVYGVRQDEEAVRVVASLFPDREIVPINSVPLIKQHGSIHCVSMQFPAGVL
ncbi:agmatine deiminase family protein [Gaoshiqia sediminis]|uniref:Agmatine deiminase family protein n=1 Tax=Gaoshiqia sediminis TaxID=2986998 RepID=A0AA41Y7W3_9BACT|nr:agmatine deiminase family protein [Gaoshiqia sediminis]MCW0483131.1 agmatine deiminase family protein [Gaoshiqia sediminis]